MATALSNRAAPTRWVIAKRIAFGLAGIILGGVFLWLALRGTNWHEVEAAVSQLSYSWLFTAVLIYLSSIAVRCLRWGILLRASVYVKWRHAAEVLIAGYSANCILPARLGELFRADYARRLFHMSRLTSLGTIVVERVCDGVVLVSALWICIGLVLGIGSSTNIRWVFAIGTISSVIFGVALFAVVWSRQIDLGRFGVPVFIGEKWDRLSAGISSVTRKNKWPVLMCSVAVWTLETLALSSLFHAFGTRLSLPQTVVLLGLASLSTLVPTAPGYIGTYQFVFGKSVCVVRLLKKHWDRRSDRSPSVFFSAL